MTKEAMAGTFHEILVEGEAGCRGVPGTEASRHQTSRSVGRCKPIPGNLNKRWAAWRTRAVNMHKRLCWGSYRRRHALLDRIIRWGGARRKYSLWLSIEVYKRQEPRHVFERPERTHSV